MKIERMDPADIEKLHMETNEKERRTGVINYSRASSPKFSAQKSPKAAGSPTRRGSGTFKKV